MKKLSLIFCSALLFVSTHIFAAAESTTSVSAASTKADLDAEIKDAKMRADSGSKSKFSASLNATYAGASLSDPFDDERPQIGRMSRVDPVSWSGGFGGRYRFNKNKSLYFASGFYKDMQDTDSKLDLTNPYLTYNNTFGVDKYQVSNSAKLTVATEKRDRDMGLLGIISLSSSILARLNHTGLSGGIFGYVYYSAYENGYERYERRQIDYAGSIGPMVDYRFNDQYHVYTQIRPLSVMHFKANQSGNFDSSDPSQTLGVGYSPVRDFYISPFVSFEWNEMSSDKTAVNLYASINVF